MVRTDAVLAGAPPSREGGGRAPSGAAPPIGIEKVKPDICNATPRGVYQVQFKLSPGSNLKLKLGPLGKALPHPVVF